VEKLWEVVKIVCKDKGFINVIESQGDEVRHVNGDEFAKITDRESQRVSKLFKTLIQEKK
jgi:hypothetical protein